VLQCWAETLLAYSDNRSPRARQGVFKSAKDTVAIESTLVSEAFVTPHIQYVESWA
jgi:hypothetical protein